MLERLRIPWAWTGVVVVFIIAQTACVTRVAYATKMHYIHWNTSNPIFRIDNTDHIIDVNKGNVPYEYDQVNIICPVYTENRDDDAEKYIIYNVSKEEYDTCRITNPSPRIIAVCDKPYKLMYFTITFRSFTPQPGGLEFKPGQDYYFISTSSRHDLHRRIGGRCTTHNMKVVFKVCCDPASQPPRDQANGISISLDDSSTSTSTTKSPSSPSTPKSSTPPSTTISTTTVLSTTSLKTTSYKSTATRTKSSGPKTAGTKKETRPNKSDAVKKELTLSGGQSQGGSQSRFLGLPSRLWLSTWLALLSLGYASVAL